MREVLPLASGIDSTLAVVVIHLKWREFMKYAPLASAMVTILATASSAATLDLTVQESGADVTISVSGAFDVTGVPSQNIRGRPEVFSAGSLFSYVMLHDGGAGNEAHYKAYDLNPGMDTFGHVALLTDFTYSGDAFGLMSVPIIAFAQGYAGEVISGTATFSNETLATLGFTEGHSQTIVDGANTVNISIGTSSVAPVPLPASLPLLAVGLGGAFALSRRKAVKA
jgi:hypothetical protein